MDPAPTAPDPATPDPASPDPAELGPAGPGTVPPSGTDALADRARMAVELPLQHALGVEFLDPDDPIAGLRFPVRDLAVVVQTGRLNGAALGAVIESAGFLALLPALTPAEFAVTISVSTQLMRAALAGDTVAVRGTLVRRARTAAFVTVTAQLEPADPDQGAPVLSQSQITKSIIRNPGAAGPPGRT